MTESFKLLLKMVTKTVKDADFCIMFLSEILSRLLYTLSSDEVSGGNNGR